MHEDESVVSLSVVEHGALGRLERRVPRVRRDLVGEHGVAGELAQGGQCDTTQ